MSDPGHVTMHHGLRVAWVDLAAAVAFAGPFFLLFPSFSVSGGHAMQPCLVVDDGVWRSDWCCMKYRRGPGYRECAAPSGKDMRRPDCCCGDVQVRVGSLSDPRDFPGLAHFLVHILPPLIGPSRRFLFGLLSGPFLFYYYYYYCLSGSKVQSSTLLCLLSVNRSPSGHILPPVIGSAFLAF